MIVAVDETGSFKDPTGKSFGIVTLVTVTDTEWNKFSAFMGKLFPDGFVGVKGRKLTKEQREKILKYIGSKPEIKYTAFLYDLTGGSDKWVDYHKKETIRKAEAKIATMKDQLQPSYVKDIHLYLNQLKNYSVGDYAKFVMFTELFIDWQRFFQFDYVHTNIKNDSWRMHHIIDAQNQPNKFLRLVRSTMILTTSELNPNYGIFTPKEWSKNHPFIVYHSKDGDVQRQDGRKFYEDFRIGDEKVDPPLVLPDIVGHTIMTSILKRKEKSWLKYLRRLKPNRSFTITTKHKDSYYHITGFDKSKDPRDVNPIIKEHWIAMKNI